MLSLLTFFPHVSFILLCVSRILWVSKKQSGSSDSPQKSDQGITSQLRVLLSVRDTELTKRDYGIKNPTGCRTYIEGAEC